MKTQTKSRLKSQKKGSLDIGALTDLLNGKSRKKAYRGIDHLAEYFDALAEFVRVEYEGSNPKEARGFIGFINDDISVVISKEVMDLVSRNKFGSSVLEVLIPFKVGETPGEQEARKLFYHTQFRKTMKSGQADLAHTFFNMLEPTGIENLLTHYRPRNKRIKKTTKR